MSTQIWKDRIIELLEDKQGQEIQSFPVESSFADHFVIASALSVRHLWTLCHILEKECKNKNIPFRCQGKTDDTSWIVFDVQDVLVHLFLKEEREYYNIESLWNAPPPSQADA